VSTQPESARWQRPDGVQVVRQYANCDRLERIAFLNRHVDPPEPVYVPHEDVTRSVGESDGEEEDAAFDVCTTVSRHGGMRVSYIALRGCKTRGHGAAQSSLRRLRKLVCVRAMPTLHGLGRETLGNVS